jgi:hypothetical protein
MNHHARNNLTGAIENEKASVSWSGYGAVSSTVPVIPDLLHIAVSATTRTLVRLREGGY